LNTESSYDWVRGRWTVPIDFGVAHLVKLGGQRVQFGMTGQYFVVSPAGPTWGFRFTTTFLFPTK
jgi:hypothetical protein